MTSAPEVRILATPEAVAEAAAEAIAETLARAIEARDVAHWATTGGSSAPPIYRALRQPRLRDRVDWGRVHVWWGDDRFVPADHPLSNVLPLTSTLLELDEGLSGAGLASADVGRRLDAGVRIPPLQVHPFPIGEAIGRGEGPGVVAAAYARLLLEQGPVRDEAGVPALDLVVLGVGPDGHILSVFPGSAAWDDPALCLAVPAPVHVEPHVERVTMHPRLVTAARRVLVVTTGATKADVLARAWTGDDVRELPVRAARRPGATWLLDEAAAASLPRP